MSITVSQVIEDLRLNSIRPKKSLGQNFLVDRNLRDKIIGLIDPEKDDTVLEIGPGLGALTESLAERCGRLIVVEKDRALCDILRSRFQDLTGFTLINGDILDVELSDLLTGERPVKVVGNLPYNISVPIISKVLDVRKLVRAMYVTVQKEVGMRICAKPGSKDFGPLTCFVNLYADAQIDITLKAGAFFPRPKVDSVFISLNVYDEPRYRLEPGLSPERFVKGLFSQRRKKIVNSVLALMNGGSKSDAANILERAGISSDERVENLTPERIFYIVNMIYAAKKV